MLVIRLYIAALTATFLCATGFTRGLGILERIVIVCPLVFMILDMHIELRQQKQFEKRITNYLAGKN